MQEQQDMQQTLWQHNPGVIHKQRGVLNTLVIEINRRKGKEN